MSLDTYVTLQEAVQQYGLDAELVTRFVNDGRVRGGKLDGTLVLLEKDAGQMAQWIQGARSTRKALRAKVAHLENHPISMGAAARKYDLTQPSISRWAKAGYIRFLHRGGHGKPTLIDESDVAYAKELVKLHQAGQGKQGFTPEYLPNWF
jgi:hypothetical protein